VNGSSDFHGTHKTVRLGAFPTAPEAYEKIVAAVTGVPVLRFSGVIVRLLRPGGFLFSW
jgi:hypothetical protein